MVSHHPRRVAGRRCLCRFSPPRGSLRDRRRSTSLLIAVPGAEYDLNTDLFTAPVVRLQQEEDRPTVKNGNASPSPPTRRTARPPSLRRPAPSRRWRSAQIGRPRRRSRGPGALCTAEGRRKLEHTGIYGVSSATRGHPRGDASLRGAVHRISR
ncbi:hypothetical protein ACRAWF_13165 [Streptomyces sp. L7]